MKLNKEIETQITKYSDSLRDELIEVWEKSVLETHTFLKAEDFESIKQIVSAMNFNDLEVYCLVQKNNLMGFIGVYDFKVEMLFLSPEYIGKGFGKKLLEFAIKELKADKVDVNEQNLNAFEFYKNFGFVSYERSELDDQGNPYPILKMKLIKS